MTDWTTDELDRVGGAEELQVAPVRADGTLSTSRPIWVVRHGVSLYVRSFRGTGGAWFRSVQRNHEGHIEAGGVARDVTFAEESDPGVNDALDTAYRAKYGRCGESYVGPLTGQQAHTTTLRLVPR
jgi:hypothetical protein